MVVLILRILQLAQYYGCALLSIKSVPHKMPKSLQQ